MKHNKTLGRRRIKRQRIKQRNKTRGIIKRKHKKKEEGEEEEE